MEAVLNKESSQEHIRGGNLDHIKPHTNTEIINNYEQHYDAVNVTCLPGGGSQIRVVCNSNLVPHSQAENDSFTKIRSCTRVD